MPAADDNSFLCPECGSVQSLRCIKHNSDPLPTVEEVEKNPWLGVLEVMVCGGCGFHIPLHLAQLWDGMTASEAQGEWMQIYRAVATKELSPCRNGHKQKEQ